MEKEKEALERKIEDLESTNNNNNEAYKPIDMFRVSNFYLLGSFPDRIFLHFMKFLKIED